MGSLGRAVLATGAALLSVGCAALISNVTNGIAEDLSSAVLSSQDLGVVEDGLPAYLILIDALVEGNPNDASLLTTAAMLNGSYATGFVTDEIRQKHFATKGKQLALRAACQMQANYCTLEQATFEDFGSKVENVKESELEAIYVLASNWAGWIQAYADDYLAVAELPRAKLLMERVIELDSNFANGSPYIYMGVFATFLPAALGGQPEVGRENFERAIAISDGANLYAKVMMAELYARALFDRDLHDQLLAEVVAADPTAGDLTLQNVVAQKLAVQLQDSADEFF